MTCEGFRKQVLGTFPDGSRRLPQDDLPAVNDHGETKRHHRDCETCRAWLASRAGRSLEMGRFRTAVAWAEALS